MAIDLHKEHYDENGVRKPLTVYPDVEAPEIYHKRKASTAPLNVYPENDVPEIYPQEKVSVPVDAELAAEHGGLLSLLRKKRSFFATAFFIAVMTGMFLLLPVMENDTPEPQMPSVSEAFSGEEVQAVNISSEGNISLKFVYDTEDSGNITVMTKSEHYPVTFTSDESTLSIECGGIRTKTPVTVVLPQGFEGKIKVEGGKDCNVTVNAGSDLDISIFSGKINVSGLNADRAKFYVLEGSIDISGSKLSELSVHVGNGKAAMTDCHIADSLYTRVIKGKFTGRRIVSDGTSSITATGGTRMDDIMTGGDIYCEDIRLRGKTELVVYSSIKLYRADFRDTEIHCDSRWSSVKIEASQPAEVYSGFCQSNYDAFESSPNGLYELHMWVYGELEPDIKFDCGSPASPQIDN